ncbi:MAG: hypothetical protein K8R79_06380, partial [Calditrichales bacterium]|nr:hypothetical protein [Calditrichales bacterium]
HLSFRILTLWDGEKSYYSKYKLKSLNLRFLTPFLPASRRGEITVYVSFRSNTKQYSDAATHDLRITSE